jgi:hypothetical protein
VKLVLKDQLDQRVSKVLLELQVRLVQLEHRVRLVRRAQLELLVLLVVQV